MTGFTAGEAVRRVSETIGRKVDVVMVNSGRPTERCWRATRPSTRRCCPSATCRRAARSSRPTSGCARSRGTTAGAWRTRCGACWRGSCCSGLLALALGSLCASWPATRVRALRPRPRQAHRGLPRPVLVLLGFDRHRPLHDLQHVRRCRPWPRGCSVHRSGDSCARMSVKSPPLLMLSGAKVAMSTGPAHSSRCLISSQLRPSPPLVRIAPRSLSASRRGAAA